MKDIAGISLASLAILIVFKLASFIMFIVLLFNCCVRVEDKRRKLTYRALVFSEFRIQALNVEYIEYQKRKFELWFTMAKFGFLDAP